MGKCEACRELTKTPPAASAAAVNNNFVFRRHFSFSKEEKPVNVNTKAFCNPSFFIDAGDTRFAFLYPVHTLHSYYLHKLSIYTDIHKNQPTVTTSLQSAPVIEKVAIKVEPVVERIVNDQELMRIERRKKAALFLDQMKKERVAGNAIIDNPLNRDRN